MKRFFFTLLILPFAVALWSQRLETVLSDGWQFCRDEIKGDWQQVEIPHDWAIAGPFDKKWDLQRVAIVQNGEREATEKSGRSGALPWIGEGHYRRTISIPEGYERAELVFDGAMAEPIVRINGRQVAYWPYGYNAFRVEIPRDFITSQPCNLLLEVDLKNVEESSRWYPGAGIYRPVTLILTHRSHLDDWSICFRCIGEERGKTLVEASAKAVGMKEKMLGGFELTAPDGSLTAKAENLELGSDGSLRTTFRLDSPQLWSPETPYMYKLTTKLSSEDGSIVDTKSIKTGIRTVRVSREYGFQLNGVTRKIKGVCLHHDLGPLGAALNRAALIRQIKIMKAMGCDAIRTSHNMPSQWQMEICDSLGMMVMAESFDMWNYPKCRNGYSRFFREWSDRDITNLVLANRNHPCIVMWSIGNEIPEQWSEDGRQIAIRLQGICHALDPTRPVTQGCDRVDNALASGFMQAMDVPGLNYRLNKYQKAYETLTHGFLLGSETSSTVSSRGVYHFPVVVEAVDRPNSQLRQHHYEGQCSGYDVNHCSWSNLPDDDWCWQDDNDWVIGEFVWTGFDYLGEPSPYDEYWPSRSSYFGICDLAGLPKDRYFLYRSHWNTQDHTIHLLPHWTWGKERVGMVTPVYCYTDYPSAELFVNGKSMGKRSKILERGDNTRLDRYRLRWNDVKYESGELKVVVYDEHGLPVGEKVMRTAGKPARLQLDVWTQHETHENHWLKADGEDLAFFTVSLTDKNGTLIPEADDQLTFEVTGAGCFEAVCNGDATSLESFKQPTMKLFNGQLVVVVRSTKETGTLTLRVNDARHKLSKTFMLETR